MSLNIFTWSKVIVPVQGNLCFASSMWNIICKYPGRRLLNKNWKGEEIFSKDCIHKNKYWTSQTFVPT